MDLPLSLANLKSIDPQIKDLVSGFIKQINTDNSDTIIPSLVISICVLFYNIQEFFSVCGDGMMIEEDGSKVSMPMRRSFRGNSAYGNVDINDKYDCIYSWTLKIVKKPGFMVNIGIDASNKAWINSNIAYRMDMFPQFEENDPRTKNYYVFASNGCVYSHEDKQGGFGKIAITGLRSFEKGDICKMEINTKERTFAISVNEKTAIAFDHIEFDENKSYNLAVSLYANSRAEGCIQIIDFHQRFAN